MKTHEPQSTPRSHSVRRTHHQGPRPILLAVFGDDSDAGARDAAVDVARRLSVPIHVLSVWNPTAGPGSLSVPVRVSAARDTLEQHVRELTAGGATGAAAHLQPRPVRARPAAAPPRAQWRRAGRRGRPGRCTPPPAGPLPPPADPRRGGPRG